MKKLILIISLILFTACKAPAEGTKKSEDIKKSYNEEQIETFLNMELGEQRWIYTNISFIRVMGGWIVVHEGVCFIPYDTVQREAKERKLD